MHSYTIQAGLNMLIQIKITCIIIVHRGTNNNTSSIGSRKIKILTQNKELRLINNTI